MSEFKFESEVNLIEISTPYVQQPISSGRKGSSSVASKMLRWYSNSLATSKLPLRKLGLVVVHTEIVGVQPAERAEFFILFFSRRRKPIALVSDD